MVTRTTVRAARPAMMGVALLIVLGLAMLGGLFLVWRMKNAPEEQPPAKAATFAAVPFVPATPSDAPSALPWETAATTSSGSATPNFVAASQGKDSPGRPVGLDSTRLPPPSPPPALPPATPPASPNTSAATSAANLGFKAAKDPNKKVCKTCNVHKE